MSDLNEQVPDEIKDSPHFAQVRKQRDDAVARVTALEGEIGKFRGLLTNQAVELAGFKPKDDGSYDNPAVPLVIEKFQASITDEVLPSKEAFASLAAQYGLTPAAPTVEPGPPSAALTLAALQANEDALRAAGTPPAPPADLDAQIGNAETAGDYTTSRLLKNQKASALMGG